MSRLLIQSSPFLRRGVTTPGLMLDVVLGLVPVILAALWHFGLSAGLVLAASTAGAVLIEWLFGKRDEGVRRGATLKDYSAILTGILLGLTLPPGVPLWIAFIGGAAAIGLGKAAFGGLGQNPFNPALVGRAFLQAAFPTVMTTWSPQAGLMAVRPSNLALPFMQGPADIVTSATPLGMMKFEHHATDLGALFFGNTAGSLGETNALIIILCGLVLMYRRTFDWRIPASILLTVAAFSGILWLSNGERFPSPMMSLLSGGLLFGAVYMATDPVTCPLSPAGAWIFGIGVGVLVVLIRQFGGLPEGVMYAILLMNAATPLIERFVQPRALGRDLLGRPTG